VAYTQKIIIIDKLSVFYNFQVLVSTQKKTPMKRSINYCKIHLSMTFLFQQTPLPSRPDEAESDPLSHLPSLRLDEGNSNCYGNRGQNNGGGGDGSGGSSSVGQRSSGDGGSDMGDGTAMAIDPYSRVGWPSISLPPAPTKVVAASYGEISGEEDEEESHYSLIRQPDGRVDAKEQ